jgi:AbrB family looped-hinge helix DNA binding protein
MQVRVNDDGWLTLPATVRRKLGLSTGDRLDLELSDDGVLLRPVRPDAEAAPRPTTTP